MCEPCHSIVQYPNNDDDDRSSGTPVEQHVSRIGEWFRKIGRWLHLSKMGNGHSEAIKIAKFETELWLPTPTYYEVDWWRRYVHLDGGFRSYFGRIGRNALDMYSAENLAANRNLRAVLQEEALDAAKQYANACSIGNMTTFRRFLTASLQKTQTPLKYVQRFELMLTRAGRDLLAKKMKHFQLTRCVSTEAVGRLTKGLLWFTRKRELLIPEWADDKGLWVPEKPYW
jgi:hypothetical protein